MRASVQWAGNRAASLFNVWGRGYRRLAESHGASVGGDALYAVALAGTLFFSVPSTEARENVALYLLLTLAPFAVLGPLLGYLFERSPGAYRAGLALSALGRAGVAIMSIFVIDSLWLFPIAFTMLVLSRFYGISRSSVLPVVVRDADQLVDANARLARIGVLAGAVVLPFGAAAVALIGAWPALVMAALAYAVSAFTAVQLPPVPKIERPLSAAKVTGDRKRIPRRVRLARFATGGVRFLNGYLLFLVAFAFRDVDAGVLSLSALLAAAGFGYFLAALVAPSVEGYVSEEPMVVGALAILAGAAFIGAQVLTLWAAMILVGAAGFSWGMAKFGFDGMLQVSVAPEHRGRAFTNSETLFQIAWVIGALIPVLPFWPTTLGLSSAGVVALIIQVVYVTLVLLPETVRWRRRSSHWSDSDEERGVLDLL
jgi:hypothetical protein